MKPLLMLSLVVVATYANSIKRYNPTSRFQNSISPTYRRVTRGGHSGYGGGGLGLAGGRLKGGLGGLGGGLGGLGGGFGGFGGGLRGLGGGLGGLGGGLGGLGGGRLQGLGGAALGSRIFRYVSVHVPPEEPQLPLVPRVITAPGERQTHYNIIFVKAPSPPLQPQTEVILPEAPEQKTLVYVLVKKPGDEQGKVHIRGPPPTPPVKPEVYFIQYKAGAGLGAGGPGPILGLGAGGPGPILDGGLRESAVEYGGPGPLDGIRSAIYGGNRGSHLGGLGLQGHGLGRVDPHELIGQSLGGDADSDSEVKDYSSSDQERSYARPSTADEYQHTVESVVEAVTGRPQEGYRSQH